MGGGRDSSISETKAGSRSGGLFWCFCKVAFTSTLANRPPLWWYDFFIPFTIDGGHSSTATDGMRPFPINSTALKVGC